MLEHNLPRLSLRVGITGHRTEALKSINLELLADRSALILNYLKNIVCDIDLQNKSKKSNALYATDLIPSLRLSTLLAAGADSLVADAAIECGYNLNILLPFPRQIYEKDFDRSERLVFDRLIEHEPATTRKLELNLATSQGDPEAYATAGRVMLAHTDILIAIWDGQPAKGVGGTAEIVSEAQKHGIPILWLSLDGELQIWSQKDNSIGEKLGEGWVAQRIRKSDGYQSAELVEQIEKILLINSTEAESGQHNADSLSPEECLVRYWQDKPRQSSHFAGYKNLHQFFGGNLKFSFGINYQESYNFAQPNLRAIQSFASEIGGSNFSDQIKSSIQMRWMVADSLANHYANRFRSAYVSNFLLAALAVSIGLLVVVMPIEIQSSAKFWLVIAEVAIIIRILVITKMGTRGCWQQRWLDYRSLAEALRPASMPLLMGSSLSRSGTSVGLTPGQIWVAWYVRAILREIPPPNAELSNKELLNLVELTIKHEIDPQIKYHQSNAERLKKLDHNMEKCARILLWATVVLGVLYILSYGGHMLLGGHDWAVMAYSMSAVVKPWVTFFGGTLPVFGAALFGIRATGDFGASSNQSERTLSELYQLRKSLLELGKSPDRSNLRQMLARVVRTMSDDVKIWGMIYSERHLEAGF